uniref:Thioredoxin domain-containing protein n=1 Tax=Romanomermis culicivorax TaxID=13658 RepID=A0A915KZS7_ROMCU
MATLFKGQKLMRKVGTEYQEVNAEEVLKNKVVGLYFSAHWCPPCRMFTPILKEFYGELTGEQFEIVFVSFDRSDKDLKVYLQEAHGDWCFLPFGSDFIQTLSKKYDVSGIPAFLIIKPNGDCIEKNARNAVQNPNDAPTVTLSNWKTAAGI